MSYENNLDLDADKQISDYILHDEIGSGGFAKVVQGIHIPTGEKVAIKIMDKIQLFTDPLNLSRVKTEISLLKIVRHKNIIKLYEVIETPQKIYLIMEYCEGGELFDYIVKKQNLTERQSCYFFHEIIDALEYLHSLNIVHRDLKPENLLLDKTNKKLSLKIIDFGISNTYTMQSLLTTPCGTASYAPPEMHKGEKYYGLLTDIWSAGVVLYAMVFGYLPFCDDDEDININNIIAGNYEIPSSASPELYDLLLHILDINPLTRYDIEQIKLHPWYNMISSDNNRPGLVIGYHKIPVDERIINICKTYGYDPNKVRESVIKNNYDNNSSIYYIILNKMKSMGIESISDLNSSEYLNYINDPLNIFFNKQISCNTNQYSLDDNNKNEIKYQNIYPTVNIQFSINSNYINKKNNFNNQNISKNIKKSIKKINILENKNNLNNNINERRNNNSCEKNNVYQKLTITNKKVKPQKKKLVKISQLINRSFEKSKKKENNKKQKINNNNLIFQTNKTFSINSKMKMNINDKDKNIIMKKNESFDKKLTDDVKEKILKFRNPKINNKNLKKNEAQLKLQLKLKNKKRKKNDINIKIGQKLSIFNKDRKKHTIIHNRNASATPNRYKRNKNINHININYINNNININNIYIQKMRKQSSSISKKHKKNNSSHIKYEKILKNNQNIIIYHKNSSYKKNNVSSISTLDNIEKNTNESKIIANKFSKKFNSKNNNIKQELSGHKNAFKKILKNIDRNIICKSDRNHNSLTNRRKQKNILQSKHFISFLKKYNNLSVNKRLKNQNNNLEKSTYINDINSYKKNYLFHTSFNYNQYCNTLQSEYHKTEKEKNKILISIKNKKKDLYNNEFKENCSISKRSNKLTNCISPIHKNRKAIFNKSNKKNKNKNNNLPLSLMFNTNRVTHKKCISMKYMENNSSSFNYDINNISKIKLNNKMNNSFRERDLFRTKEKFDDYRINLSFNPKKNIKRKVINLSFKNKNKKYNKEEQFNKSNYKSEFSLNKNDINKPKKYCGPIDIKNIVISSSGLSICDGIGNLLKKKLINFHRINPYRIVCWKNLEMIEINIYQISGNIVNIENNNYIKNNNYINLCLDSGDLEYQYNNTFTGFHKKNNCTNKYNNEIKRNIFYINILSQKEKKNNKSLFEIISKFVYNNYSLEKGLKK